MSPENDNNLQPSAIDTRSTKPLAENSAVASSTGTAQAGAGTAVARAPEAAEITPSTANSDSAETSVTSTETASAETAGVDATSSEAATSETTTPAAESAEPETTETMEQLLDQFSAPQAAAEGKIFDGRVLSITDAGVIVDVGGKFEGLVPAQEFLESGEPIQFGEGQTIEVERLHERKDGYVLLS